MAAEPAPAATAADDQLIGVLSRLIRDLVLDGRLGPDCGSDVAAEALACELDRSGFKIVGARTGTLAGSRTTDVSLAQYQQILGERNALLARIDDFERRVVELLEANNREVDRRRDAERQCGHRADVGVYDG